MKYIKHSAWQSWECKYTLNSRSNLLINIYKAHNNTSTVTKNVHNVRNKPVVIKTCLKQHKNTPDMQNIIKFFNVNTKCINSASLMFTGVFMFNIFVVIRTFFNFRKWCYYCHLMSVFPGEAGSASSSAGVLSPLALETEPPKLIV